LKKIKQTIDQKKIFKNLNREINLINKYATDLFNKDLENRSKKVHFPKNNNELFKMISVLIFYSQNAKSYLVDEVVKSNKTKKIFKNYNAKCFSRANPCDIVEKYWDDISAIRQKTKVFQIVLVARLLKKNDICRFVKSLNIPDNIKTKDDIDTFWDRVIKLKEYFQSLSFPFLSSTTTILHFLMEIGFPSIKPDSAVQKAFNKLSGNKIFNIGVLSDDEIKQILNAIQEFAITSSMDPKQVDLYLLTIGGQSSILNNGYINPGYY